MVTTTVDHSLAALEDEVKKLVDIWNGEGPHANHAMIAWLETNGRCFTLYTPMHGRHLEPLFDQIRIAVQRRRFELGREKVSDKYPGFHTRLIIKQRFM